MGCTGSAAVAATAREQNRTYSKPELATKNDSLIIVTSASESHNVIGDFHGKYLLSKKIGLGHFAQVRTGMRIDDPFSENIAVKILDLRAQVDDKEYKYARMEESVWETVGQHKNCVRLFEVFYGDGFCYMVMEKCSSCLLRHMHYMSRVNERTLGHLFAGMLQGLAHVHSTDVIYRDVKPDNFIIGQDGCTVKLCDFGFAVKLDESGETSGLVGTAPYMCPEMLWGDRYGAKADAWAVGVIAYAFFFGDFPYVPKEKHATSMRNAILTGKTPEFKPVGVYALRTDTAVAFIKALLTRNPTRRPTAEEALAMQFMKDVAENRHAFSTQLPSLRPMLLSVNELGAFENRDPSCNVDMDYILDDLQTKRHGPTMSIFNSWDELAHATPSMTTIGSLPINRTTKYLERKSSDISNDRSTSCTGSRLSLGTTSCTGSRLSLGITAQGSEWSGEDSHKWSVSSSHNRLSL